MVRNVGGTRGNLLNQVKEPDTIHEAQLLSFSQSLVSALLTHFGVSEANFVPPIPIPNSPRPLSASS